MMGLTKNFAKTIMFCGHGSTTINNAYASGLDCGACGGNHGGTNAHMLAQILNDPIVRENLNTRGLKIPPDTLFIADEHDTTTDAITIYNDFVKTEAQLIDIKNLKQALTQAQKTNAVFRNQTLNSTSTNAVNMALKRSCDWAEVRPEWRLAKNAAFIVGPRWLTKDLDLEGRCFLHSYDYAQDDSGTYLEIILTAPMVVAEWINMQYFFSTIDNVAYGSGSKITQNVVGKIGVMQGNASDLMYGLPLQSVNYKDDQRYHEPMRLLTLVYAPREKI